MGGVSIRMVSNSGRTRRRSSAIRGPYSRALAVGEAGPLVRTNSPGIWVGRIIPSRRPLPLSGLGSRRISLRPCSLAMPKICCSLGLRRSASINRTFLPISAMAIPRLLTTVDLPSAGPALVTARTLRRPAPSPENRIESSTERNASEIREGLRCHMISSTCCVGPALSRASCRAARPGPPVGMTPSSGRFRYKGVSPGCRTLRSARSRSMTNTAPRRMPAKRPSSTLRRASGL